MPRRAAVPNMALMTADEIKRALTTAYPTPKPGSIMPGTKEAERAVTAYTQARDALTVAKEEQETAGNVLRQIMGDTEIMRGDGYECTWKLQRSEIDWNALADHLNVPDETIERFRKPPKRVLNVREKARQPFTHTI